MNIRSEHSDFSDFRISNVDVCVSLLLNLEMSVLPVRGGQILVIVSFSCALVRVLDLVPLLLESFNNLVFGRTLSESAFDLAFSNA